MNIRRAKFKRVRSAFDNKANGWELNDVKKIKSSSK